MHRSILQNVFKLWIRTSMSTHKILSLFCKKLEKCCMNKDFSIEREIKVLSRKSKTIIKPKTNSVSWFSNIINQVPVSFQSRITVKGDVAKF